MSPDSAGQDRVELNPPRDVRWIANRLREEGFETWAVGGAVRDALAGKVPGDWDLTTSAKPPQVRRIFRRTVPLGIEHGTVGVIGPSGTMYEVTTFRRDVETFGRRARVVFAERIEEDLDRRDFTMNAVAWHPVTGEVRDPHRGAMDLEARILRTVGEPELRFEEDRLRVLRALRFAGSFGLDIEPATWAAIRASADKLGNLSPERVREELRKVLGGQRDPTRSLQLYAESGVLAYLYPELDACRVPTPGDADPWSHSVRAAARVSASRFQLRVAALIHSVGSCADRDGRQSPVLESAGEGSALTRSGVESSQARSAALARNLLRRLRFSNADTDRITHLIAQQRPLPQSDASDAELRRWLRRIGPEFLNDLLRLNFAVSRASGADLATRSELARLRHLAAAILAGRPALSVGDLAIDGNDLNQLGIARGPQYREILDSLLERVLDDPSINERNHLLSLAGKWVRAGSGAALDD